MSHKDLDAWKKSMDFVEDIYKVTKHFPEASNLN
ncbi:four helix bundle protein [Flavobacterium suncheonense]|nr:four helix bundle protein [Flavobacterium suncheonense]